MDVTYQRFTNGFWKAVIPDPHGYYEEWISEDRLFNIEKPVYFTYPIPTLDNHNSIRDYFLIYESDSIPGNKEIILEFHPNWFYKSRINISNMPGLDTYPYASILYDSVVIFWISSTAEDNSTIWCSKTLFDPYGEIENIKINAADKYVLCQNYPNPFNSQTTIPFYLHNREYFDIFICDICGQRINTLFSGLHPRGHYQELWDGRNDFDIAVSSGLYYCILGLNDFRISRKIVLLR